MPRWLLRSGPLLVGVGLGLLALGPAIMPGFLLSYDMVFVRHPPLAAATFGLAGGPPRAVPSDAVVAVISHLIPAGIVQKLMLVLIFALACSGAAALLAALRAPVLARMAAGIFYAWNPYVAERLIIGQWALLLGYAGLPWLVLVLRRGSERISWGRLSATVVPAAVGGFAAMTLYAVAAVPAALSRGDRRARALRLGSVLAVLGLASLPWLVPTLLVPVHTSARGVDTFAARADTPFGRIGSLLMLGGIWNAETVPRGYGAPASVAWLATVLVAIAAYGLLSRPWRVCPGLGIAAVAGLAIAMIGAIPQGRGLLRELIVSWPGFGVLRDGQRFVAPLALAEAVGLGSAVAWVARDLRATAVRAATALALMATVAPVLLLPGLAWGAAGRLHPVQYPADWLRARRIMDCDPHPGSAVVLPWAAYRRYPWNHSEAVFDPWARMLARPVILNDALQVGTRQVPAEDPRARRLSRVITAAGPLTTALRAAGVRYVIVDAGPLLAVPAADLTARARLPGASVVLASGDLVVYRLGQR